MPKIGPAAKKIQDKLLKSGSVDECVFFAKNAINANIEALQQRVIEIGNAFDAYKFASVKGANIALLQNKVYLEGDTMELDLFARDIPGADKALLRGKIEEIEAKQGKEPVEAPKPAMSRIPKDSYRCNITKVVQEAKGLEDKAQTIVTCRITPKEFPIYHGSLGFSLKLYVGDSSVTGTLHLVEAKCKTQMADPTVNFLIKPIDLVDSPGFAAELTKHSNYGMLFWQQNQVELFSEEVR